MPPLVILYHSAACGSFDDRRLPPSGVAPCILSVAVASYERRTGLTRTSSSETARDINGHLPTVVLVFIKIRKTPNFAAPRTTPPLENAFFFALETPDGTFRGCSTREADVSDTPMVQPTDPPRTSPSGSWRPEHMPRRPSCGCLP